MLVLTRKTDQSIQIGDGIEIVVLDVRKNKVRIGIVAPPELPVHRTEVAQRIQLNSDESCFPHDSEMTCDQLQVGVLDTPSPKSPGEFSCVAVKKPR